MSEYDKAVISKLIRRLYWLVYFHDYTAIGNIRGFPKLGKRKTDKKGESLFLFAHAKPKIRNLPLINRGYRAID